MRRHLVVGVVLAGAIAAAVAATMAFAGGDPIPTCGGASGTGTAACTAYRVDWNLGPPQALDFQQDGPIGQASIVGLAAENQPTTFDIYAYNWGVSQTSTTFGGGGGIGKSDNQDFTVVKAIDVNSPLLALACERGVHFPSATVTVKAKGGTMTYAFQQISCSLDKQGSGGEHDAIPLEQFSWSYNTIQWVFTPNKGGDGPVSRCFNIVGNNTTGC
jgi:type VI secretion system secreted protein Hcp